MLTVKRIEAAKAGDRQYKLADGHGLYLLVTRHSVKSWRTNYRVGGKQKTKVFGKYPEISLAAARLMNAEFKDSLASGNVRSVPTFDEVKKSWYKKKLPTLRNIKHRQQIQYRADTFISPSIGTMAIDTVKRVDLVKIVHDVEMRGTIETAHRVGTILRQIFDYAVDIGVLESHPATNLSRVLQTPVTKHMPCVTVDQAPKLFKDIQTIEEPLNRLALIFNALTFVRPNEMRFMKREEIKDQVYWVIPEDRMKGREGKRKPHVVPLSKLSLKILQEIDIYTGDYEYVFQSPVRPNKPFSENCLLDALYGLGYRHKMTVHGFRALASTVLNEQSPFSRDVIERQLAHKETDAVRAAYNRAEYLTERVKLMDWWSDWVGKHLSLT